MVHIPVDNTVSLSDSLASFQAGENLVDDIAEATIYVTSDDPSTVLKGFNLFATIQQTLQGGQLNSGSDPALSAYTSDLKTKFDTFLQSVPLMHLWQISGGTNEYLPVEYGSEYRAATMYDLVNAIATNDTTDKFYFENSNLLAPPVAQSISDVETGALVDINVYGNPVNITNSPSYQALVNDTNNINY